MKRSDLDSFEKVVGQLEAVYDEFVGLSKKAPNDAVNRFKLGFVNSLVRDANGLLGGQYRPFGDFSEFDIDSVPQNSDVTFILSQYLQCFEKLRADNVTRIGVNWYWVLKDPEDPVADENGIVRVQTVSPKRLRDTK